MKYLLILLLGFNIAQADLIVKYGAEIPKKDEGLGASKALFLSYQSLLNRLFIYQYETGFWADNAGSGRKSSFLTGPSIGVNVEAGYFYAQALSGPAIISATDSLLGGHLQFNNDVSFGIKDLKTSNTFGIDYKHISSAGLASPNAGRDFILIKVGIGI